MKQKLTEREEEIYFELITNPGTLTDIASKVNLAYSTVQTYTQRIYYKFGITSRAELIINHYQKLITNKKD